MTLELTLVLGVVLAFALIAWLGRPKPPKGSK